MKSSLLALIAAGLLISGCASSDDLDAFFEEVQRVSDPVNALCIVLQAESDSRIDLPTLDECARETQPDGAGDALFTVWGDPAENAAENKLTGDDWPFAAVLTVADWVADSIDDLDIDLVVVGFNDRCTNVFEFTPQTAVRMSAPGADVSQIIENDVELYGVYC